MTTKDTVSGEMSGETLDKLTENLSKVDELRERLTRVMTQRSTHNAALDGPNQELFGKAATAYWQDAIHNPAKLIEQQMGYWSKTMAHFGAITLISITSNNSTRSIRQHCLRL